MSKRFLEVWDIDEIEGVIAVGVDGYAQVHIEWLQVLLEQSGRDWKEVRS